MNHFPISFDDVWTITLIVLMVFGVFAVLMCFISCCYAHDCFCNVLDRIFCCLVQRDRAFEESSILCGGGRSMRRSETNTLLGECRIVQYNTDEIVWGCFRKKNQCRNSSCTICLDEYILREDIVLCPCGHCYHRVCLKEWLRIKNFCPQCKCKVGKGCSERTPLLYNQV